MAISAEARARWREWKNAGGEAAAPLVGAIADESEVIDLGGSWLIVGCYLTGQIWRQFIVVQKPDGSPATRFRRGSVTVGAWSAERGVTGLEALGPELVSAVEGWLKKLAKPKKRQGKSR